MVAACCSACGGYPDPHCRRDGVQCPSTESGVGDDYEASSDEDSAEESEVGEAPCCAYGTKMKSIAGGRDQVEVEDPSTCARYASCAQNHPMSGECLQYAACAADEEAVGVKCGIACTMKKLARRRKKNRKPKCNLHCMTKRMTRLANCFKYAEKLDTNEVMSLVPLKMTYEEMQEKKRQKCLDNF